MRRNINYWDKSSEKEINILKNIYENMYPTKHVKFSVQNVKIPDTL